MLLGVTSYASAAAAFTLLTLLLLTSWRGRLQGGLLVIAVAVTVAWSGFDALGAYGAREPSGRFWSWYHVVEVLRTTAWIVFLFRLLEPLKQANEKGPRLLRYGEPLLVVVAAALVVVDLVSFGWEIEIGSASLDASLLGSVVLAVSGLLLIEQLFRNTKPRERWAVKYLFLGIGAIFAYDFFLFADAMLFHQIDLDLWQARGFVNALAVPLIAVSVARNPAWSIDIFVSRKVVFHTAALLGAGGYLLAVAGAGYYVRAYGGSWGGAAQAVFLSLALVLLFAVLFSGHVRARVKIFVNKHFFNYKYDYREEWLRLTATLSEGDPDEGIRERVVRGIADIVDSSGGYLWLREDNGRYRRADGGGPPEGEPPDSSLISFLEGQEWLVNLEEYGREPEAYEGLELPDWLRDIPNAWLIVPLRHQDHLVGFIVLVSPRAHRDINWEDRDLLRAAGRQAASYLALLMASEQLSQARQFEAFNRLVAYVVHDLKNVTAQLGLIVSNAKKHKRNPEFVDDVIRTIDNTVHKMNRMLAQLRKGSPHEHRPVIVSLEEIVQEVARARSGDAPVPTVDICDAGLKTVADPDRLAAVIGHIVQNAQEATAPSGRVGITVSADEQGARIEIADDGCGMDAGFVREELFRPFHTTKGNAGMGVGAFEAREYARALGGDLHVASEPGVGTTIVIHLPLHEGVAAEASEPFEGIEVAQ